MRRINIPTRLKGHVLTIILCSGIISIGLYISFLAAIVRARIIDIDNVHKQLELQSEAQLDHPRVLPKIAEQRRLNHSPDFRCLSWAANQVGSGWKPEDDHSVFFVDYYIPPDRKAIICTTPALATAITAVEKPLLYEIYPTDYGLHIRIIIGVSEAVEPCKRLTGNVNCTNSLLSQQAVVKYEP